jgi:hypothetical protein
MHSALPLAILFLAAGLHAEERRNWFNDPFEPATQGLPGCPPPLGPLLTAAEMRAQAHPRAERGTRCWQEGRCATPNAYADDPALNAAAARALRDVPALASTQLWVTTQRRFVFLQGCVREPGQRLRAQAALRALPGVDYVGDEIMIGTRGTPPYPVAAAATAAPAR